MIVPMHEALAEFNEVRKETQKLKKVIWEWGCKKWVGKNVVLFFC